MTIRRLRLRTPLALTLIALAAGAAAASCASGVVVPTGTSGAGGTAPAASNAGSGGMGGNVVPEAGMTDAPPDVPGTCVLAADCVQVSDPCNVGACVNSVCVKKPGNEGLSCDDGQYCTENDACQMGVCVGGSQKFCSPPDTCHIGVCDEATKSCKGMAGNDSAACDDMDACTQSGTCIGGSCTKGPVIDCSVFNSPCTTGICKPGVGCVASNVNEGTMCDDGKGMNGCSFGQCMAGLCVSLPKNDGQACDDGKFCTVNDHCQSSNCVGDPNLCPTPNDICTIGVCDEPTKKCTITVGNDGKVCEDGNPCTSGETCASGLCIGGKPANEGMMCDDKNGCTNGTSCASGVCTNATSQVMACVSGDMCCPAGCTLASDADCLYWVPGVQIDVAPAILQGWTQCFIGKYGDGSPTISTITTSCSKSKLLMACRQVGQQNWKALAMGLKTDVMFDTGVASVTHSANGVGWYFNNSHSWGFAPDGDVVSLNSCDTTASSIGPGMDPDKRLCWHTGGGSLNGGWRCGKADSLNGAQDWERAAFHAD